MSHQGSRSARARSLTLAAALFAALAALSILAQGAFAGTPLNGGAAPLTGSTFQGADGDQRTPLPGEPDYVALPARTDWQNYAASPRLQKLPDGSGLQDTWFKQGKEQEPDGWTFQQTAVTPGKADVLGAWTVSDPASANVYLYLSFFRDAAGGTTFYDFELNQQATTWTNRMGTVIPCRRDGDVIVTFELQGGAGDVGVDAWRWRSDPSQPGPAACPQGKIGTWSHTGALSTDASGNTIAQGAMNTGEIDNYLDFNLDGDNNPATDPSPAKFSTPDTFGEAALNLSKVLAALNQGDSCFNFGQLQLHTRASSPFTADLKDFIAPKPIVARSCSVEGTKYHDVNANGRQDAGETGLAGFRIYADKNDNNAFDAGEPSTFTADGSSAGGPLGSWTLTKLPAGNSTIREDLSDPAGNPRATEGWTCSDPVHGDGAPASGTEDCEFAVSLAAGGTVSGLSFGNYKPAVIKVEKQTAPDGVAGSFAFTSTIPGKGSFNLSDGGVEMTTVTPGIYTATESGHPDFDLTGIACTGDADSSGAGQTATFRAQSGETITCVFTNTRKTGQLTVRKVLDPVDDEGTFDLKIGDDVVAAAVGDGGHGSKVVAPGTYDVSEAGAGGTALADYDSAITCVKNDEPYKSAAGTSIGGLAVDSDDAIVCTITNTRLGSVTVTKTEGGRQPSRSWTFRLTGGPDGVDITENTSEDGNPLSFGHLKPGDYTLCEIDLPAGWHSSLGPEVDGKACVELDIAPGEAEAVAVDNTRPETLMIKEGNVLVHHGDTITYTFDVSNAGNTPLKDLSVVDERCDTAPVRDAAHDKNDDGDTLLETGEVWRFTCTMVVPDEHSDDEENPIVNVATAHAFDEAGNEVTDTDDHRTTIIHPAIAVEKTGAEFAYAGDTVTYTFAATNDGDTSLHDVSVSDDRCAPAAGPTGKSGGNADDLLDPGETWTFTCANQIPAGHAIGDENPIRNVATASGKDALGKPVTSTDDHRVRVLHPAVDIEKTGPAGAAVGAPLGYTLTVTNPGDVPFAAQEVVVADPRCEAPPAGPHTGADATPGQLDPGDTWTYTCTAQTTGQHPGTFVNTATVTAKDFNGRTVSDTDAFPTTLDDQQVLPEEVTSGTARLHGPSGCVKHAFNATVRGRKIASVTFYVDGAKLERVVARSGQRVFRVKVRPAKSLGVHRVTARVVFKASSRTKARTLRLSFRRCARQIVTPQFTG
jgi:hypothetical protein